MGNGRTAVLSFGGRMHRRLGEMDEADKTTWEVNEACGSLRTGQPHQPPHHRGRHCSFACLVPPRLLRIMAEDPQKLLQSLSNEFQKLEEGMYCFERDTMPAQPLTQLQNCPTRSKLAKSWNLSCRRTRPSKRFQFPLPLPPNTLSHLNRSSLPSTRMQTFTR